MFTTAGETFLTIGDKEGTGVSPTAAGMAAGAAGAITASVMSAARARSARFMVSPGRSMPGEIRSHSDSTGDAGRECCAERRIPQVTDCSVHAIRKEG